MKRPKDKKIEETGNERQGGVSDHWGQMQPMFGGGGGPGHQSCWVRRHWILQQGSSWRPPLALPLSQQSAPLFCDKTSWCEASFKLFILMEEFHRRPAIWPFSSSHSSVQRSRAAKGHLFHWNVGSTQPWHCPLPPPGGLRNSQILRRISAQALLF